MGIYSDYRQPTTYDGDVGGSIGKNNYPKSNRNTTTVLTRGHIC